MIPPSSSATGFLEFVVALSKKEAQDASDFVKREQAALLKRCQEKGAIDKKVVDKKLRQYVRACCEVPSLNAKTDKAKDKLKRKDPILSGNSIHTDYQVIRLRLPGLFEVINYRLVDVTTLKELVRRWRQDLKVFEKEDRSMVENHLPPLDRPVVDQILGREKHDPIRDMFASIAEVNYYRKMVFTSNT